MRIQLSGVGCHRRDDVAFGLHFFVAAVADQIGDGLPGMQVRNQFDAGVTGTYGASHEKRSRDAKLRRSLHVDARFERGRKKFTMVPAAD